VVQRAAVEQVGWASGRSKWGGLLFVQHGVQVGRLLFVQHGGLPFVQYPEPANPLVRQKEETDGNPKKFSPPTPSRKRLDIGAGSERPSGTSARATSGRAGSAVPAARSGARAVPTAAGSGMGSAGGKQRRRLEEQRERRWRSGVTRGRAIRSSAWAVPAAARSSTGSIGGLRSGASGAGGWGSDAGGAGGWRARMNSTAGGGSGRQGRLGISSIPPLPPSLPCIMGSLSIWFQAPMVATSGRDLLPCVPLLRSRRRSPPRGLIRHL
jgi:hypothetical protein